MLDSNHDNQKGPQLPRRFLGLDRNRIGRRKRLVVALAAGIGLVATGVLIDSSRGEAVKSAANLSHNSTAGSKTPRNVVSVDLKDEKGKLNGCKMLRWGEVTDGNCQCYFAFVPNEGHTYADCPVQDNKVRFGDRDMCECDM